MSTTRKLWLGFGTLIAMFILVLVPMLFWLMALRSQVNKIAVVAGPLNEAVHEMEINVNGIGVAVTNYLHVGKQAQRDRVEKDIEEFRRYRNQFDCMADTEQQQELGKQIDAEFGQFVTLGQRLMDQKDAGDLNIADLERFSESRIRLDECLDLEIQQLTLADLQQQRQSALVSFRRVIWTAALLLLAGLAIAVTSSLMLGRGVLRTEEVLRTTLTSIGDAVVTTDQDGRIAELNPIAQTLTGWNNDDALSRPHEEIFQIVDELTRKKSESAATRVLRTGQMVGFSNRIELIARDGNRRSIEQSAAPVRGSKGTLLGVVLTFRDITEKQLSEKSIKESEARKAAMLNTALDGIITIDEAGKIVELNDAAEEMFGYPQKEAIGRRMSELIIPPEFRDRHHAGMKRYFETGKGAVLGKRVELRAIRADKSRFPVEVSITPIQINGHTLFTGYIRDISRQKRAEASRLHFKALFEASPGLYLILDPQFKVLAVSDAYLKATNNKRKQILRKNLFEIFPESSEGGTAESLAALGTSLERVVSSGVADVMAVQRFPVRPKVGDASDVEQRYWSLLNSPVFGPDKELAYIIHRVDDVTDYVRSRSADSGSDDEVLVELKSRAEQMEAEIFLRSQEMKTAVRKLKESDIRFRQLADAMPQLVWTAGPDGSIDWYNDRWFEYTGTTHEEVEGWGWQKVHHPDTLPEVMKQWRLSVTSETPFEMVFPLKGADGKFRPFLTRVIPFRDENNNVVRWIGTNTDISEQEKMQDELRHVAARLSEADRRKDEFLATLAHELRNPLAPIRTGLEALRKVGDDPGKREKVRQTMERQTLQMVHLVDDLLDVSRVTRGKLKLRLARIDLNDVIQSAIETTKPMVDQAGHTLNVDLPDEPLYLNADSTRLAQVFSNLINNAAKYTSNGGTIDVSAHVEGDGVTISVKDNGVGIPDSMKDRIFEMFGQVDRTLETGYAGLGIGLTLVKSMVLMHGGRVEVFSAGENQGSEFKVHLQLLRDAVDPAPEISPREQGAKSRKLRILVVDDNESAAEMLKLLIEMMEHEVQVGFNGFEAIEKAQEFRPDLVLMDIGMPKLNGYEAAREIRDRDWGQDLMLVALTGWGQEDDRRRSAEAGFDFHLIKPVDPDRLEKMFEIASGRMKRTAEVVA